MPGLKKSDRRAEKAANSLLCRSILPPSFRRNTKHRRVVCSRLNLAERKLGSKRVPAAITRGRLVSHKVLRRKMSEVISLRERVKQAELLVDVPIRPQRSRASLRRPQR